jgi:hypothetical protein
LRTSKRKIQNIPDASALLPVAMKYEDGSVTAKIESSLHDQYMEVERPFVRSRNSPDDGLFEMRDANRGDLGLPSRGLFFSRAGQSEE